MGIGRDKNNKDKLNNNKIDYKRNKKTGSMSLNLYLIKPIKIIKDRKYKMDY